MAPFTMVYRIGGRHRRIALQSSYPRGQTTELPAAGGQAQYSGHAARLDRHRVTIHCETRRNWYDDAEAPQMNGYFPTVALGWARDRRQRFSKLHRDVDLASNVVTKLKQA